MWEGTTAASPPLPECLMEKKVKSDENRNKHIFSCYEETPLSPGHHGGLPAGLASHGGLLKHPDTRKSLNELSYKGITDVSFSLQNKVTLGN